MKSMTSSQIRSLIREGKFGRSTTSGLAGGEKQANLVIVPSAFADDIEEICRRNAAPLPLLYKSGKGEVGAPPLAQDSDVRTDVSSYDAFEFGVPIGRRSSLLDVDWSDLVTFYLGCSFSFEAALQRGRVPIRNMERGKNVAMYKTSVFLFTPPHLPPVPMVVSLRPLPPSLLETCFSITAPMADAHGAPVHVGAPGVIGIEDVMAPDFGGEAPDFEDGDVPVFWACGVTGLMLMEKMKSPISLTHSPGNMFLCDVSAQEQSLYHQQQQPSSPPQQPQKPPQPTPPQLHPRVFRIYSNPLHYSVVDAEVLELVVGMRRRLGGRGGGGGGERGGGNRASSREMKRETSNGEEDEEEDEEEKEEEEEEDEAVVIDAMKISHAKHVVVMVKDDFDVADLVVFVLFLDLLKRAGKSIRISGNKRTTSILKSAAEKGLKRKIEDEEMKEEQRIDVLTVKIGIVKETGKRKIDGDEKEIHLNPSDAILLIFAFRSLISSDLHERYARRGLGFKMAAPSLTGQKEFHKIMTVLRKSQGAGVGNEEAANDDDDDDDDEAQDKDGFDDEEPNDGIQSKLFLKMKNLMKIL